MTSSTLVFTSRVETGGGGWDPAPSSSPSSASPNTVPSSDVVNKCAEFAANAKEITGPACTSAELSNSTCVLLLDGHSDLSLASDRSRVVV